MKAKYKIAIALMLLILLAVMGVAAYNSMQLKQLQQQQQRTAQALISLNDQFVALQRNQANQPIVKLQNQPPQLQPQQKTQQQLSSMNSKALLRAQLQLVQFALSQHEYLYAFEQLQKIDQGLSALPLATALKQSLAESFIVDRQQLQQQSQRQQQQQTQLLTALDLIDRQLQVVQKQPEAVPVAATQLWWQNWFKFEPVQTATPDLLQRLQRYQTLQWRLQLAQQALLQGQSVLYLQQLNHAQQLLIHLPDSNSRDISLRLTGLQQQPNLAVVQLQSLALLQESSAQ